MTTICLCIFVRKMPILFFCLSLIIPLNLIAQNKCKRDQFISNLEKRENFNRKDSIVIIFAITFNDSLSLFMNRKRVFYDLVETNPSADVSLKKFTLNFKKKKKVHLLLKYKKKYLRFIVHNQGYKFLEIYTPYRLSNYVGTNKWYLKYKEQE